MNIKELAGAIRVKKSYLCVGLDTDATKIPIHLQNSPTGVLDFNKAIIDATLDYCVAYKVNTAFYEAMGLKGWEIMAATLDYIPKSHFTIADAKRGDIGNTSAQYAKTFFETLDFDSITVAPYMGRDSVQPFLDYTDKTTIVLGLTSNQGAGDFEQEELKNGSRLYETVLRKVAEWGSPDHLMFVVGATQAAALRQIREIVPEHFLLVPGVGAQGGSLEEVSAAGFNNKCGLLINVSRGVIYAASGKDFAEQAGKAARKYQLAMAPFVEQMV